ncbi:MAG TPA: tetratricopeptide repeat protein [Candidatus Baltobacteraceae bacterium]|nr:tetratricopeptide repeat protein [Candidatus Baltobacteraceae bacterium]
MRDLRDIDERLQQNPGNPELLFARACILDQLGRNDEARDAYIEVIKRNGSHVAALGNLGTLLYNAGYRSAARLTYAEALKHDPSDLRSLANLGNALLESGDLPEARQLYERAIALDPAFSPAHQGLSHVLGRLGEHEAAEEHRQAGFAAMPVVVSAFRGAGAPVSVLLLCSAYRGNVPTDVPFDDRTFMVVKLFTDYYEADLPLPPHDVIFNGIGDADLCEGSLLSAHALLQAHGATAINPPELVRETGRVQVAQRLRNIDGLIVPHIEAVGRDELARVERYPVLVRAPGYHAGEFFELARDRSELESVAAALPGERLLTIELLDARGADGAYRKYRVLSIGGRLYPVHLARSTHWKVHYFSADLARTPEAVAEEEAFLRNMRTAIGERAMRAIETAAQRIGLEYFGIDFGLDARGNVLFFEANATMRAVVPVRDDPNEARRAAALAANAAIRELVLSKQA